MVYSTPEAIREIKKSPRNEILIDGQEQCKLQAMSFALNYHKIDVTETPDGVQVKGVVPVGG